MQDYNFLNEASRDSLDTSINRSNIFSPTKLPRGMQELHGCDSLDSISADVNYSGRDSKVRLPPLGHNRNVSASMENSAIHSPSRT